MPHTNTLTVGRDYRITIDAVDVARWDLSRWLGSPGSSLCGEAQNGEAQNRYVEGQFLLDEETVRQFFALLPVPDSTPRRQVHYEYEVCRHGDRFTVSFSILATLHDAPEVFTDTALRHLVGLIDDAEDGLDSRAQDIQQQLSTTATKQWRDNNQAAVAEIVKTSCDRVGWTHGLRPNDQAALEKIAKAACDQVGRPRRLPRSALQEVVDTARERLIQELADAVFRHRNESRTWVRIGLSRGHHWTVERGASARDVVEDTLQTVASYSRPLRPNDVVDLTDAALLLGSDDRCATAVAGRLLGPARRRQAVPRVIDTWAPSTVPIWGSAVLGLLVVSVVISPVSLVPPALVVMPSLCVVTLLTVIGVAWRRGASLSTCLLGIAAPVTIALFAAVYGWLLLPGGGITASVGGRLHMVDPLLLAVGIATTEGTFDYLLHGYTARLTALVEMLLLLTIAGTTAFAVARQVLRSLQATRVEPQ